MAIHVSQSGIFFSEGMFDNNPHLDRLLKATGACHSNTQSELMFSAGPVVIGNYLRVQNCCT